MINHKCEKCDKCGKCHKCKKDLKNIQHYYPHYYSYEQYHNPSDISKNKHNKHKIIFVCRHGNTLKDESINEEKFRNQSIKNAELINNIMDLKKNYNKFIFKCSPYKRCSQTAEIIKKNTRYQSKIKYCN